MRSVVPAVLSISAVMILIGCSEGSIESTSVEGKLVDAPVEGVSYRCGRIEGTTLADGAFSCDVLPVTFYVGGVKLGTIEDLEEDGLVFPQDLVHVNRETLDENVTKIAVFLQSIDDDGIIEEGIRVDEEIVSKLHDMEANLSELSQEHLEVLLENIGAKRSVTPFEALEHLRRHMRYSLAQKDEPNTHVFLHPSTPSKEENTPLDITSKIPSHEEKREENVSTPITTPERPIEETTAKEETERPEQTTETMSETKDETASNTEEPDTKVTEVSVKRAYLDVINEARAEGRTCGEYGYFPPAPPLTWNDKLYAAAYEHSKDMALSNTFSHTGSGTKYDTTAQALHPGNGSSVGERIEYNGYTPWRRYGENIAAGTSMQEAVEAMEGWLESPGHCKNIMKAEFKEVGMAMYYDEKSRYGYYWTQDFGTLR